MRIEAADRAGRERLLRYCARPPYALDRLRELDPERLLYEGTKPGPGGNAPLLLTPLELLDRLAALVPPPRIHRHRYFGVLAPNSPLRTAVTTLALAATTSPPAPNPQPAAEPAHRRAARYAWALLLARIYEVFPLVCPHCGGAMRIIAFITAAPTVRDILVHLGEPTAPPPHRARPRSTTVGDGRRRARADPRSGAPAHPGLRVRPAHRLVATTVDARTCATPGGLVPAAARLPARGHPGVSARAKVQRQACGTARCHRKSTLDPPHRLSHTQARVLEMAIL